MSTARDVTDERPSPLLALSLSDTQANIVASCYQHRLLSTAQIAALHTPDSLQVRWAQHLLRGLEERGWLTRVQGRPPGRQSLWFVTAAATKATPTSLTARVWA